MNSPSSTPHNPHDKGYKYLLSSKKVFLDLLRSFIQAEWTKDLREEQLERVDKSYILSDFREKEADLVYQVNLSENTQPTFIFYILIEMQSSVDYQMPWRLLLYQVEIWRDYLKNRDAQATSGRNFSLPTIVPIVLYNGESPWTAARRFRQLQQGEERFGQELLDFYYLLIDVHRYQEAELLSVANVMSSVFLLDQTTEIHELTKRLTKLGSHLKVLPAEQLDLFFTWMKRILFGRFPEVNASALMEYTVDIYEGGIEQMLTNIERVLDKAIEERWHRGKTEGKEEGVEQVALNMLREGLDVSLIVRMTGVSEEKLKLLKKQLN